MDSTLILQYDCYNEKVISEKQGVMTTNDSKDMKDMLKSVWDQIRSKLTRETLRASSILQVRLQCQSAASGTVCGPWECRLGGRRSLDFDLKKSGEYTASNSRGEEMKKTWEKDEDMKEFLKKTSVGDGKRLAKVLVDRKKELETAAAPNTAAASTSPPTVSTTPSTAPGAAPSKATTNRPVTSIIPVILAGLIILWLSSITVTEDAAQELLRVWSSPTRVPSSRPPCCHLQLLEPPGPVDLQELQPLQPPGDRGATADATFLSSTPWK
ncbi:UL16-binding protein 3-like isoform X2 [Phyllostomus hastatus]|nr:UL16-binding protein 3-like isoform X2 [Phyllostomus hastatus]